MSDRDYATNIFNALSSPAPLSSAGFEVALNKTGNVARLVTTVLRSKLPRSEHITAKSSRWEGGVIAFKNHAANAKFWTKVTQRDLDGGDGPRAWVCSSVDPERALLRVWVIPFSIIRDNYANFPEDAEHRRDLKITAQLGGWSFNFNEPVGEPPDLGPFYAEYGLDAIGAFVQARTADAEQKKATSAHRNAPQEPEGESQGLDLETETIEIPGSNRIYFGPPGTGKSYQLRNELKQSHAAGGVRTVTFHPEYTYADFVGSYRPSMIYGGNEQYRDAIGTPVRPDGRPAVIYKFVPGPLIQMICRAMSNPGAHLYLIIEEINRGNCAAIFGDLFQLLDRLEDGESEYAVWVEADLMTHVQQQLAGQPTDTKERFDREGLFIPSNLSIYATMNTSDQSLYPMDSAMKRRWEMRYVPIDYEQARGRRTAIRGYGEMDWGEVLLCINKEIVRHTRSDDKQVGQWFVKGQTISDATFRDKVLSYLWFDVFRQRPEDLFDLTDGSFSYESLVAAYNAGKKVFKNGVLDGTSQAAQRGADGR
jgi:hypothetical protein